jgi:hypothetical protein
MKKNKLEKVREIRIEEINDNLDGLHFYRVYFYHENGKIDIMSESSTRPVLARYTSKVY